MKRERERSNRVLYREGDSRPATFVNFLWRTKVEALEVAQVIEELLIALCSISHAVDFCESAIYICVQHLAK